MVRFLDRSRQPERKTGENKTQSTVVSDRFTEAHCVRQVIEKWLNSGACTKDAREAEMRALYSIHSHGWYMKLTLIWGRDRGFHKRRGEARNNCLKASACWRWPLWTVTKKHACT